jgi:outer membrane protein assembly factor BamB
LLVILEYIMHYQQKFPSPVLTILIILSLFISVHFLSALDWNQFRGPDGNGVTEDSDWDYRKVSNKKIAWSMDVGRGYSAVSTRGTNIYTMGNKSNKDYVYCIDMRSGTMIWQYTYDAKSGSYPGPRATPAVEGNRVYTVSREGYLLCLNADTGKKIWDLDLVKKYDAQLPRWGLSGSPVVTDSMVFVNAGLWGIAVTADKGKKVWVSKTGSPSGYSTHTMFEKGGRKLAAVLGADDLYIIDRTDGSKIDSWSWPTSYEVNAANAMVIPEGIVASSAYGAGSALFTFDGKTLDKKWGTRYLNSHFSTPIYHDGYIYGSDHFVNDGVGDFVCIDAATGKEMWREPTGVASVIMADKKLVIITESGNIRIASATPGGWKQLAAFDNVVSKRCWTAPVLANGRIFIRNDSGKLVCIDVSK